MLDLQRLSPLRSQCRDLKVYSDMSQRERCSTSVWSDYKRSLIITALKRMSPAAFLQDQERLIAQRRVPGLRSQLEEYKSAICQLQAQKQRLQTEVWERWIQRHRNNHNTIRECSKHEVNFNKDTMLQLLGRDRVANITKLMMDRILNPLINFLLKHIRDLKG